MVIEEDFEPCGFVDNFFHVLGRKIKNNIARHTEYKKQNKTKVKCIYGVKKSWWVGAGVVSIVALFLGGGKKGLERYKVMRNYNLTKKVEILKQEKQFKENEIEMLYSRLAIMGNRLEGFEKIINQKDKNIETLIEENYFPMNYDNWEDESIRGIVIPFSQKNVSKTINFSYKNKDEEKSKSSIFVYNIIKEKGSYANLVFETDPNYFSGKEVELKTKKIPKGIFDLTSYIKKIKKAEPITSIKLKADNYVPNAYLK